MQTTAGQSSRGIGDIRGAAGVSDDAAATRASNGNYSGSLESVVVEGCGLPKMNGTFKKSDFKRGGYLSYVKSGKWNGENCFFEISTRFNNWWIGVSTWWIGVSTSVGVYYENLYLAPAASNRETPPENGWSVIDEGDSWCVEKGVENLMVGREVSDQRLNDHLLFLYEPPLLQTCQNWQCWDAFFREGVVV